MSALVEVFAYSLLIVSFLYLFACVDPNGNGILAKMRNFFWDSLPNFLRTVARKICGECFVNGIDRVARYICYEPNPLV